MLGFGSESHNLTLASSSTYKSLVLKLGTRPSPPQVHIPEPARGRASLTNQTHFCESKGAKVWLCKTSAGTQLVYAVHQTLFTEVIQKIIMYLYPAPFPLVSPSLVPTPHAPPGEKWSGERSRISWAYSPKRWKTNEIARSLIIM